MTRRMQEDKQCAKVKSVEECDDGNQRNSDENKEGGDGSETEREVEDVVEEGDIQRK